MGYGDVCLLTQVEDRTPPGLRLPSCDQLDKAYAGGPTSLAHSGPARATAAVQREPNSRFRTPKRLMLIRGGFESLHSTTRARLGHVEVAQRIGCEAVGNGETAQLVTGAAER